MPGDAPCSCLSLIFRQDKFTASGIPAGPFFQAFHHLLVPHINPLIHNPWPLHGFIIDKGDPDSARSMIRLLDLCHLPTRVLRVSRYPLCGVIGMRVTIGRKRTLQEKSSLCAFRVSVVRLVLSVSGLIIVT